MVKGELHNGDRLKYKGSFFGGKFSGRGDLYHEYSVAEQLEYKGFLRMELRVAKGFSLVNLV